MTEGRGRKRARENERARSLARARALARTTVLSLNDDLTELPGPPRGRGHARAARADLFGSDGGSWSRLAHDVRSPLAAAAART